MAVRLTLVERPTRVMAPPIVLERANKRDGKKAGKPRLKEADRAERRLYRAMRRSVKAADKGLRRYDKARRASDRKERDGAVIDLMPNMARGMAVTTSRLAIVPLDLMRAASVRKVTRRSLDTAIMVVDRS